MDQQQADANANALLEPFDTGHKGYLQRSELPHSYQLALRRGPAGTGAAGSAAILEVYRTPPISPIGCPSPRVLARQ